MQKRAIRSRQALLEAARIEFSPKGFHGARVDSIAARAKINKQRIYAYFKNKAGLFSAVRRTSFEHFLSGEQRLLHLTAHDVPHLAALILSCYMDMHERYPDFWRLLAWENLDGARHSAPLRGLLKPVYQHLRSLYVEGQKNGHFDAEKSFDSFMFILLAVSYFMESNRGSLKSSLGIDLATRGSREHLCSAIMRQLDALPPPTKPGVPQ